MKILKKLIKDNIKTTYLFGIKIKKKAVLPSYPPYMLLPPYIYHNLAKKDITISEKKRVIEQIFISRGNTYFPNLDNPTTFNEKIQWLNLYYHNPLLTKCADKSTFKDYLQEIGLSDYSVPTIGIYDNVNQIDFSALPDEYVIKSNWGGASTQVLIIDKQNKISIKEIKTKASSWLLPFASSYPYAFNWLYKNVKPRLIIEPLLKPSSGELQDFKIYCFNGIPHYLQVYKKENDAMTCTYFDMEFKRLDLTKTRKSYDGILQKPENLDKMIEIAKLVSKPFPLLRVDFYSFDGKIYIGEFTFTPAAGFRPFEPLEWDYKWGELLTLPEKWLDEDDIE